MKSRLLVAVIFIPLLIYIMLQGDLLLLVFTNVIIGVSLFEFFNMMKKSGREVGVEIGLGLGLAIPTYTYLQYKELMNVESILPMLVAAGIILLLTERILKKEIKGTSAFVGNTLLGIFYISFMFTHIFGVRSLPNGGSWLLTIQILMWIADSAAYFVGINFGRKFFKEGLSPISPKKSKEGLIGSVLFTIIAMFIIRYTWFRNMDLSLLQMFIVPTIVALVGMLGDLAESMFKREFEIKDSGNILGGHGGILDRFDSLIFVLPVIYYYFTYILNTF